MLNTTIQTSGDDAIAFSLTRFAAGKPRQDRYAESLTNIVLDIDTPMTLEEVAALQKWWIRRPFFFTTCCLAALDWH
jgi:hypothetical protein